MSAPFEGLEDRLLRGGIAPRHVKRYLRELSEHLADLTEAQAVAGHDREDAAIRARAALGPDAELADAMLKQRDFRSVSARFPWAVFGILPPFGAALGVVLPVLLIAVSAKAALALSLVERGMVEPAWMQFSIHALLATGNLFAMPLTMLLLTMIIWRQRLPTSWLLLALAVIAPLALHAGIEFPATAEIARQKGAALTLGFGFSHMGALLVPGGKDAVLAITNLVWAAAHYGLALLPLAWLIRRRGLAKVPFPS
jgi:hypothetical protein